MPPARDRLPLIERERDAALVRFTATLEPSAVPRALTYRTRTGATLRLDGLAAGAFDREHEVVLLAPSARAQRLELDVEAHALPTHGLPSGDGLRWRWLVRSARAEPQRTLEIDTRLPDPAPPANGDLPLWGHAHLDIAWLWSYRETRRKVIRTFANAIQTLAFDERACFVQSQPQLYAWVEADAPDVFASVAALVREGRFNAEAAALWVESDCNLPSGESLLRQMLHAHAYAIERLGIAPSFAWLPDTFGFAATLPTLLAHAGITRFATTKLQWNDTTRFPHAQFRWRGPDGSEVTAAIIDAYEGDASAQRVATARARREPLIVGYGDGGGGPTFEQVRRASPEGRWEAPSQWFARLEQQREALAVHEDELYLEYHRGVYTTHHDIKAKNAALERALVDAEERLAWCVAVRAPADAVERLRAEVRAVWEIVLRNQFHDVLTGTSVPAAYVEAMEEYGEAERRIAFVLQSSAAMLPRGPRHGRFLERSEPVRDGDDWIFDNGLLRARVSSRGTITELAMAGAPNVVAQANLLAAYRDRPKKWDAWNVDAGYEKRRERVVPHDGAIRDGALEVPFDIAGSPATMRVSLFAGEPFLRVELAVEWRCEHTLLRVENWLTTTAGTVRYGAPHGTVARSAKRETPGERARFEVPGQRFATLADDRGGLALFALDTYGWSARALPKGGTHLGHSLLRSPTWPDPGADRGEHQVTWAFAPFADANVGAIERAWERFAFEPRVRLFTSADDAVLVVAVKPAEDGAGIVVRVRECDGAARTLRLRCAGRMRAVSPVDALERPAAGGAAIEGEELVATIGAYAIRSFRVEF